LIFTIAAGDRRISEPSTVCFLSIKKKISVQILSRQTGLVHKDSSPLITGAEGIFIYSALPLWFQ